MATYIVKVPVASFLVFKVEAKDEEEAKEIVGNGDGEEVSLPLDGSWDEDSNNWEVSEVEEKEDE